MILKPRLSTKVKIADLGVSNEFDGPDAFLTNTAGTPAFTGLYSVCQEEKYLGSIIIYVLAPECLSIKQGDSPYSGKVGSLLYNIVSNCSSALLSSSVILSSELYLT